MRTPHLAIKTADPESFHLEVTVDNEAQQTPFNLYSDAGQLEALVEISVTPDTEVFNDLCGTRNIEYHVWEESSKSRRSTLHDMVASKPGTWSFKRKIELNEEYGNLCWSVVAVSKAADPIATVEKASGIILGQSEDFLIGIDSPIEKSGNFLKIKWRKFEEHFPSAKHNMFRLETDPSLVLYLNSSVDGLYSLLTTAKRGMRRDMKKSIFAMIKMDVWQSLISKATIDLSRALEVRRSMGDDLDLAFEDLADWQFKILRHWGPRIHFGLEGDAWRQHMIDSVRESHSAYLSIIGAIVQRDVHISSEFERVIMNQAEG